MPTAWKIGLKSLYLRRNYTHPKSVISSLVQGDSSRQSIPCIFLFYLLFVLLFDSWHHFVQFFVAYFYLNHIIYYRFICIVNS